MVGWPRPSQARIMAPATSTPRVPPPPQSPESGPRLGRPISCPSRPRPAALKPVPQMMTTPQERVSPERSPAAVSFFTTTLRARFNASSAGVRIRKSSATSAPARQKQPSSTSCGCNCAACNAILTEAATSFNPFSSPLVCWLAMPAFPNPSSVPLSSTSAAWVLLLPPSTPKTTRISFYPLRSSALWQAVERNQHQHAEYHNGHPDFNACLLPGAKKGHPGVGLHGHPENIGHTAKNGNHVPGGDQPQTDIGADTFFLPAPQRGQTNIPAQANDCQPDHKDANLHEANNRAAIEVKPFRLCADDKNQQAKQGDQQTKTHPVGS